MEDWTKLHMLVRMESRIVWVTESWKGKIKEKKLADGRILSFGSDLGTKGKLLKQILHSRRKRWFKLQTAVEKNSLFSYY